MKQEITRKQWKELSPGQMDLYLKLWKELYKGKPHPLPSGVIVDFPNIGQMIEFLGDTLIAEPKSRTKYMQWNDKVELCDALWEAVKMKLSQ